MSECSCHPPEAGTAQEGRVLRIVLALNAVIAVVSGLAGWIAQSARLLAEALDMHLGC